VDENGKVVFVKVGAIEDESDNSCWSFFATVGKEILQLLFFVPRPRSGSFVISF